MSIQNTTIKFRDTLDKKEFLRDINFIIDTVETYKRKGKIVSYQTIKHDPGNYATTVGKDGKVKYKLDAKGRKILIGTKWGISAAAFPDVFRTPQDMQSLTRNQAIKLYYEGYWKPLSVWEKKYKMPLPQKLKLHAFDFAINSGVERSVQFLNTLKNQGIDLSDPFNETRNSNLLLRMRVDYVRTGVKSLKSPIINRIKKVAEKSNTIIPNNPLDGEDKVKILSALETNLTLNKVLYK